MREVYERRAHPAGVAPARRAHRARHRQDHGLQGDAVLPQGRALHRVVHSRHRADRVLPDPLAVRQRRGRDGRHRSGAEPGPAASTAPAIGVPRADTIGAPLAPTRSTRAEARGVMGGTGPAGQPRRGSMPARRLAARWVLPVARPPIERGAVLLGPDGGSQAVGPDAAVPRPADVPGEEFPDGILLPGLVNTHTHLELTGFDLGRRRSATSRAWIARVRAIKETRSADGFLAAARARRARLLGGRRHHGRRHRRLGLGDPGAWPSRAGPGSRTRKCSGRTRRRWRNRSRDCASRVDALSRFAGGGCGSASRPTRRTP